MTDRFAAAQSVADAVLYEGFVLYPYRASSTKNRMRWQFGVLVPEAHAAGSDLARIRTECLIDPGSQPELAVRIRFLHVQQRLVEAVCGDGFRPVPTLEVSGVRWIPWEEAVERQIDLAPVQLLPLASCARDIRFCFPAHEEIETATYDDGTLAGRIVRRRCAVEGSITIGASWAEGPGALIKVSIGVTNTSPWTRAGAPRDEVLLRSAIGVHTLAAVSDARFLSLMDPPEDAAQAAMGCHNEGTYPVLIDDDTVILSSPIILYDHPVIAPESQGDLYDSLEIDEILALRVLTLTEEEKAEARGTDPRAAAIVERCDTMQPDSWARLHGTVRPVNNAGRGTRTEDLPWWDPSVDEGFDPWSDTIALAGWIVGKGARVILRPSRRADAHDLFLAGMEAKVAGVFHDVEGTVQLAVVVGDDEDLAWQGRYLFFAPDEVEVLAEAPGAPG
ncbi:MAG: hypothetical protein NVS3B21_17130 [Acidimicrobiales bacterium]